ncbi:MAG: TIGR03809 family protein [Achromobacter sp.]
MIPFFSFADMHMSLHPARFQNALPYPGDLKSRKVVQRWAVLAEQRLSYLTELFESGRWRRFHTETDFLDNIQEAKDAAERWRALANGEYVAPVIRETPRVQPLVAAIEIAAAEVAEATVQHEAEVLSFEDHAAQRDAARKPPLVAMSEVIVDHSAANTVVEMREIEPPVHAVSPLDLFDHDAIVARYPMLRAAAM